MSSSTPDFEEAFGKVSHCSMCGDSNFMCDCGDLPDHEEMNDGWED